MNEWVNGFGFGHHLAKSIGNTGSSPSWYCDWSASESDRRRSRLIKTLYTTARRNRLSSLTTHRRHDLCCVRQLHTLPKWSVTRWYEYILDLFFFIAEGRRSKPAIIASLLRPLSSILRPRVGPGHPSSPLSIYFLIFSPFYFFLSFLGFTYFLLLSIPSISTRIVPLRFQAGGRSRRPNLGLVCFFV